MAAIDQWVAARGRTSPSRLIEPRSSRTRALRCRPREKRPVGNDLALFFGTRQGGGGSGGRRGMRAVARVVWTAGVLFFLLHPRSGQAADTSASVPAAADLEAAVDAIFARYSA